jgi:hypothetical protein
MPSSPSDFALFPELPVEVRLKIWRQACLTLRIVVVQYNPDEGRFVSNSGPPAVLRVFRESRHEALGIYRLDFSTPSTAPHIYVHSHVDIIYVTRHDTKLEAEREEEGLMH